MKDFLGNEIKVGDFVVYVNHSGNYMKSGVIETILKNVIHIRMAEHVKRIDFAFPENIVKIK